MSHFVGYDLKMIRATFIGFPITIEGVTGTAQNLSKIFVQNSGFGVKI